MLSDTTQTFGFGLNSGKDCSIKPVKWRLDFGEQSIDLTNPREPRNMFVNKMIITQEQLNLLESIADVQVDSDGNKWFVVNRLLMKLSMHLDGVDNG